MEQIHGLLASADFDKASLDEVVIELLSETECGYYFVDHENRSLLWLHDFDILNYSNCITEVRGATSPAHISKLFQKSLEISVFLSCVRRI
jgi:hypothetical protein